MINLNQLRAFYSVAKSRTFSEAAKKLSVTQPAVLIQVRSLERYLGLQLFDKLGKDMVLTETGKLLYGYAEKIFNLVDEAKKAIKEAGDVKSGDLRVGTTNILSEYFMPTVVTVFHDHHPKVQVYLDEGNSRELVEGILARNYELAIVGTVAYPDTMEHVPFGREELVLVASPVSKLGLVRKCSLSNLEGVPMIWRNMGSATAQAALNEFEKRNLTPFTIMQTKNTEFIKNLVARDRGVSFLGKTCVLEEIDRGELAVIEVEEGPFFFDIDIIYLKGKTLSPAASAFLNFLLKSGSAEGLDRFLTKMNKKRLAVV
ncbi:MAG: HTH-type transcriptional activator CmpR [Syntrophorhabdus sp. PtaU1.Bin153]|nr:MAG: HTH-type transcriptional activator CmpR [Syntrophorhabdus sp. PtaU1.Bin153]